MYENHLTNCGRGSLKAAIVTAESVSQYDTELLASVFGAPVAVEYGMAETGVIGYSRGTPHNIKIFWDSFIAICGPDEALRISTIYDRYFPLINYCTEDLVEVAEEADGSVLEVSSICGRKQELLKIGCLAGPCLEVSGILLVHILKAYPHVFSIQFEQLEHNRVRIFLVADQALDLSDAKRFFVREIRKDHKSVDPDCIDIIQVDRLDRSLAGKERLVRVTG